MDSYFEKLDRLRSQKDAGLDFNFRGAVYTIIPKSGDEPRFLQPLRSKSAVSDLIGALTEAKEKESTVIAAWVGSTERICSSSTTLALLFNSFQPIFNKCILVAKK